MQSEVVSQLALSTVEGNTVTKTVPREPTVDTEANECPAHHVRAQLHLAVEAAPGF